MAPDLIRAALDNMRAELVATRQELSDKVDKLDDKVDDARERLAAVEVRVSDTKEQKVKRGDRRWTSRLTYAGTFLGIVGAYVTSLINGG